MQSSIALLLAGLTLPVLVLASAPEPTATPKTPQDDEEPQEDPFGRPARRQSLREQENQRIAEELEGAWVLSNYYRADTIVPKEEVQGFALFADGYMTFTLQALEGEEDWFFEERQYVIQSSVFRYRVIEGLYVQFDGVMGYTNANEAYELEFQTSKYPREYTAELTDGVLKLRRLGGVGFDFRRLGKSVFSQDAIDYLRRARTGYELIDDTDPFGQGGSTTRRRRGDGDDDEGGGR